MHISQFQPGDIIRYHTYEGGVGWATVTDNHTDTDSEGNVTGKVAIALKGGKKPVIIQPGDMSWDDAGWAMVTPEWFTGNGKRVPKALKEKLQPVAEVKPNNSVIGTLTSLDD